MRKQILLAFMLLGLCLTASSQIPTRFYKEGKAPALHPKADFNMVTIPIKTMPTVNNEKLLQRYSIREKLDVPFRFGKGFEVDFSLKDGKWRKTNDGRVWNLKIHSKDAYSLNLILDELHLPKGGELYLYNENRDVIYGPVTSSQNPPPNKDFLTDIIPGNTLTLDLFEPASQKGASTLRIRKVVHAYKNLFKRPSEKSFGESGDCNKNIKCYPNWDRPSDAVAMVLLSNGVELCSGSLLNNTDQNFRPFFLSAFHCIDIGDPDKPIWNDPDEGDKELDTYEITEAENWAFRFQYKVTECNGSTVRTTYTYNHADFRAAWNTTDFALMELKKSPLGNQEITWLGWDRTGNDDSSLAFPLQIYLLPVTGGFPVLLTGFLLLHMNDAQGHNDDIAPGTCSPESFSGETLHEVAGCY